MLGVATTEFEDTRRHREFCDMYIRWLYTRRGSADGAPLFFRFRDEIAGPTCSDEEIHRVTKWLKEMSLIVEGEEWLPPSQWQAVPWETAQAGGWVIRPKITELGFIWVEQNRSASDREVAAVNINATNSNVAVSSPHAAQSVFVTGRGENEVNSAIDAIVALLGGSNSFTEPEAEILREAVEELQDEISREDVKPQRLKKWLEKAKIVLTSAGAVTDIAGVVGIVQAAISSLP